jgi:cytochrome c1
MLRIAPATKKEAESMTVGQNVQQALAMLKTAAGNFNTFAMETQDSSAQQMYMDFSKQLDQMVGELSLRVEYLENQEPQYKVENMTGQQSNQQQSGRTDLD